MPYLNHGRDGIWDRAALKNIRSEVNWLEIIEGCLVPNFQQRLQNIDEVLSLFPTGSVNTSRKHTTVHGKMLLRIMQGEEYGKTYMLDDLISSSRSIITVGRYDEDVINDIPIVEEHSSYVSRKHCTIERNISNQSWYIRDGQWERGSTNGWKYSLNGTFLNSTEVNIRGTQLRDGDIISIGDVKLRVELY